MCIELCKHHRSLLWGSMCTHNEDTCAVWKAPSSLMSLCFSVTGLILPYPTSNLTLEVILLILYLGIDVTRLFLGCRGNLCERKLPLVVSVGLSIPAGLLALYFLLLQTYALRLETVLSCIMLLFYGLEAVLSCAALITLCREPTY
ncbi:hypothetical protein FKM82_021970 [Ascaphus truei]